MNNNVLKSECSVIVLAAGFSSRMKAQKAFLKFNNEMCFLQKIVSEYECFNVSQIIVLLNQIGFEYYRENSFHFLENHQIVLNQYPEYERFYSIKLGMNEVKSPFCFIQNVDNPFVNYQLLNELWNQSDENSVTIPYFEGKGGHPILIGRKTIETIHHLNGFNFNLKEVLENFNKTRVNVMDSNILRNINTKEELTELAE